MNEIRKFICSTFVLYAQFSIAEAYEVLKTGKTATWHYGAEFEQVALGLNLPVMALERPDWANYMPERDRDARAYSSVQARIYAVHASGWEIGLIKRGQARIVASADAKNLAALQALRQDPIAGRTYSISAHSQIWQGEGLAMNTPWIKLRDDGVWAVQAGISLLQINQLDAETMNGTVRYIGSKSYSINLSNQRYRKNITGVFLPAAGQFGTGESISIALQGYPLKNVKLLLAVNDLYSALHWSQMASDNQTINTNTVSTSSAGTLDYGPLVRGRKSLVHLDSRMDAQWLGEISWSPSHVIRHPVEFNLRTMQVANIDQTWLGFAYLGGNAIAPQRWAFAYEIDRSTFKFSIDRRNFELTVATDGKGIGSLNQELRIVWHTGF